MSRNFYSTTQKGWLLGLCTLAILQPCVWAEEPTLEPLPIENTPQDSDLPMAPDIVKSPEANTQKEPQAIVKASYSLLQLDNVQLYQAYVKNIHQQLRQNWKPREVPGRSGGKTVVNFEVDPQGQVMELQVAETSGNKRIDTLALEAIQNAAPFPTFPPELKMERMVIQYTFDFSKPF